VQEEKHGGFEKICLLIMSLKGNLSNLK